MEGIMAPPNRVKFLLNWNHFNEHLASCMSRLMTDSTYSDVIIATGDRRMIYAHRFVLANSSKYFQRLLKQMNRQRGIQLVLALPEVKYEVLKILMNYMYRGETQVPQDLLPTVLKIGRLLEISGLVDLHERQNNPFGATLWTCNKPDTPPPTRSVLRPAPRAREERKETRQTARTRARETAPATETRRRTRGQAEQARGRAENLDIDSTSQEGSQRGGRRFRPILPKNETAGKNAKKDSIHLPLKRKYTKKEEKANANAANAASKKVVAPQETQVLKIKREKLEETWQIENPPAEEVTIKTEGPFHIEDGNDNFNELVCEPCKLGFASAPDWISHMNELHIQPRELAGLGRFGGLGGIDGYRLLRGLGEIGNLMDDYEFHIGWGKDSIYRCVICSDAMCSASEWIQHLRVWHLDSRPLIAATRGFSGPRYYN